MSDPAVTTVSLPSDTNARQALPGPALAVALAGTGAAAVLLVARLGPTGWGWLLGACRAGQPALPGPPATADPAAPAPAPHADRAGLPA